MLTNLSQLIARYFSAVGLGRACACICALLLVTVNLTVADGTTAPATEPDKWDGLSFTLHSTTALGYVELAPRWDKVSQDGPYLYTYTIRNYGNLWVDGFVLSFKYPFTPTVLEPAGWDAEVQTFIGQGGAPNPDWPYKIRWSVPDLSNLGPDEGDVEYAKLALAPYSGETKELIFSFTSYNEPESESDLTGMSAAVEAYNGTTVGPSSFILEPAPVPEPTSLLAAVSILAPVGLFGRRVFCK